MEFKLKVEERNVAGKSQSKKLRNSGIIPGVVYGHGDKAVNLNVNEREFSKLLEKIKGHNPIVDLTIADKPTVKAIIKTMQRKAVTKEILSVDFQIIHAKEKITMNIPVILKGSAFGVKEGGILDNPLRSIPVRCEIEKVPDHIEVDITDLKLGHSIHVSDIKIEGVEFMILADSPIVSVLAPRKIVEVAAAPVTEEVTEPEVITEKKKEEAEEGEAEGTPKKKSAGEAETTAKKKPTGEAETKK
jgi:large subunit ribosomal protein L25